MPVEIKELVIKAVIDESNNKPVNNDLSNLKECEHDAIIEACVKKVLKILKQSKER